MSLRIRRLRLIANTINGDYGADMAFPDGLVLLHLHNTRGKSTALKSMIYCLGLERMFGQVNQAPLTPAMTTRLKDGTAEWDVVESWVYLQIENEHGAKATLRRKVAGEGGQDRKLVDVWECSMDEMDRGEIAPKPHYARDPGSAQNEQGITSWLAKFMGWKLPQLLRHDNTLGVLYIECVISLFFIEQSQGWTTIQAGTPRVFGIRQVERKAVEFILGLDACEIDSTREHLEQQADELSKEWISERSNIEVLARSLKGALRNFPIAPQSTWPPLPPPFLEVFQEGLEIPLRSAIESDKETLAQIDSIEIPTADEAAKSISDELNTSFSSLHEAESIASSLGEELSLEQANLAALETRLDVVNEDLGRNKDTKKLRDMGATGGLTLARQECPTCHQHVNDTLLSQRLEQEVMGLEENIAYLAAQKQTLEKMRDRTIRATEALERRKNAVVAYASELRQKIRYLKRTLVSSGIAPSEAAIRERIVVSERLEQREAAQKEFERALAAFPQRSSRWVEIQTKLKTTKARVQSESDKEKIRVFAARFKAALNEFGFESFPLDTVSIDLDSYRPKREGFDLAYAVSASDHVRIIAAYITALFETARTMKTNHPGLLLLDEPRQQNMQWPDFSKILKRLATSLSAKQQVIVATSDRPDAIQDLMKEIPHFRVDVDYDDWLLRKIEDADEENPEVIDLSQSDVSPS
jgi:hypothetical protein